MSRLRKVLSSLWRNDLRYNLMALSFLATRRLRSTYTVRSEGNEFRFHAASLTSLDRANNLLIKERDTIEWIDGFGPDEVFYDIGANVGAFSIYAGVARKMKVYAFEPAFHNFYLLNRNIILNDLSEVKPFNLAFSDTNKREQIFMKTAIAGDAGVNLGESVDCNRESFEPAYTQAILAYSLDSFIEHYEVDFPTHIKIDVDGLEPHIIQGAAKTLADSRLRSLLIEIDENDPTNSAMMDRIVAEGFKAKKSPLAHYQAGAFINYIFSR